MWFPKTMKKLEGNLKQQLLCHNDLKFLVIQIKCKFCNFLIHFQLIINKLVDFIILLWLTLGLKHFINANQYMLYSACQKEFYWVFSKKIFKGLHKNLQGSNCLWLLFRQ